MLLAWIGLALAAIGLTLAARWARDGGATPGDPRSDWPIAGLMAATMGAAGVSGAVVRVGASLTGSAPAAPPPEAFGVWLGVGGCAIALSIGIGLRLAAGERPALTRTGAWLLGGVGVGLALLLTAGRVRMLDGQLLLLGAAALWWRLTSTDAQAGEGDAAGPPVPLALLLAALGAALAPLHPSAQRWLAPVLVLGLGILFARRRWADPIGAGGAWLGGGLAVTLGAGVIGVALAEAAAPQAGRTVVTALAEKMVEGVYITGLRALAPELVLVGVGLIVAASSGAQRAVRGASTYWRWAGLAAAGAAGGLLLWRLPQMSPG